MDAPSIPELSREDVKRAEKLAKKRAYNKQYYAAHTEEALAYSRAYHAAHQEQRQEYNIPYQLAYRAAHLEERRAENRVYNAMRRVEQQRYHRRYREDPEHREQQRLRAHIHYASHAEEIRPRNRRYHRLYTTTTTGRAKRTAGAARRRASIAAAPVNDFTDVQWRALCKSVGYLCCYCGKKFPLKDLTPDHLTPYNDNGSNTLHNVLPCCGHCNSRKGHRAVLKPVQPFLLLSDEAAAD